MTKFDVEAADHLLDEYAAIYLSSNRADTPRWADTLASELIKAMAYIRKLEAVRDAATLVSQTIYHTDPMGIVELDEALAALDEGNQ
jgi:hypothetical protein